MDEGWVVIEFGTDGRFRVVGAAKDLPKAQRGIAKIDPAARRDLGAIEIGEWITPRKGVQF